MILKRNVLEAEKNFSDSIEEFLILSKRYVEFGKVAGVDIVAFHDSRLPHFSCLENEQKRKVLDSLRSCVEICETTTKNNCSVGNSKELIWYAIKHFGFRPPSDLFSFLTSNEDIIEMHSIEGLQIFCSFNFYGKCSYSLEELLCCHWSSLFGRSDDNVNLEISELMRKVFFGEVSCTFPAGVRPHTVFELKSSKKKMLHLEIKYAAPLFFQGDSSVGSSIVIERACFLKENIVESKDFNFKPLEVMNS